MMADNELDAAWESAIYNCKRAEQAEAEIERLRAENNAAWDSAKYNARRAEKAEAEIEASREALRLVLLNAYSPENVIEIVEAALAAGRGDGNRNAG